MTRLFITGANGHLGRRLINTLPDECEIVAVVRSERARRTLLSAVDGRRELEVTVADPGDPNALSKLAARCDRAVHLIGTIKETRADSYASSHESPARALAQAAANLGLKHIVYISILGAHPASDSKCLRARAAVEKIFSAGKTPATVVRIPMVLGERDRATKALKKRAAAKRVILFRAASLEQPIYAGDVIQAMENALALDVQDNSTIDLAGPESLTRRALVIRAARVLNNEPAVYSLPLVAGMLLGYIFESSSAKPKLTRDMLRILDHDDMIDPAVACAALGITLTPLDEMLRRCMASSS